MSGGLLLDTIVLIWWLSEPERLPTAAVDAMADPTNLISCSVVNLWEIQIKASLGKLDLRLPLADVHAWIVEREQWALLAVRWEHIQALDELPSPHRDPSDRSLVAQAIAARLTLVSSDSVLLVFSARAAAVDRVVRAAARRPADASTPRRIPC